MEILYLRNKGYGWTANNGIYIRGYIQLMDNTVLKGKEATEYLSRISSFEEFCSMLQDVHGSFSIIIDKGEKVWAAVDVARSMPLYYSEDLSVISDSSEAVRKELGINAEQTDRLSMLEFYATFYVAHENTVYKNIKQIELGQAVEFLNKDKKIYTYFEHINDVKQISREEAIEKIESTTDVMLNRLKAVIGERQVVISLSGGYDSRYVACSLKRSGIDNVVCYTYGKETSFEIQHSKRVAASLGYKWYCFEYTDKDIESLLSEDSKAFFDYCNNNDYMVYLQNYIAVKKLIALNVIDDNAVFLTGLCNDMPTGQYINSEEELHRYPFTAHGVAAYVVDTRFVRVELSSEAKDVLISDVTSRIEEAGYEVKDYQSFVSVSDVHFTAYEHSREFLHMNDVHEFFGHEWIIPCWDKALLKMWYSFPVALRTKQNVYEEYVTNHLGARFGITTKKVHLSNGQSKFVQDLKRIIGGIAVQLLYPLGIPLRRGLDINNFAKFEVMLYNRIIQKEAIIHNRASIMLLAIYVMEQRYGTKWYKMIKGLF